jgi:hypothetical protein
LLVKRFFLLLNAAFAMAILDLISQVHLSSSVNKLPKYLKHFTFSSCFWSIFIVTAVGCLEIPQSPVVPPAFFIVHILPFPSLIHTDIMLKNYQQGPVNYQHAPNM